MKKISKKGVYPAIAKNRHGQLIYAMCLFNGLWLAGLVEGVVRCTQQHCWCIQQLCEWAKLSLSKKHEYLYMEEGSSVVVIFNCGRTFFRGVLRKKFSARWHGRRFFRCCYFQLRKNPLP